MTGTPPQTDRKERSQSIWVKLSLDVGAPHTSTYDAGWDKQNRSTVFAHKAYQKLRNGAWSDKSFPLAALALVSSFPKSAV